jgi:hypothetical protein
MDLNAKIDDLEKIIADLLDQRKRWELSMLESSRSREHLRIQLACLQVRMLKGNCGECGHHSGWCKDCDRARESVWEGVDLERIERQKIVTMKWW